MIYLDVTIELSLARMRRRQLKTHTTADIHEQDVGYLERCLHTAGKAADYFNWHRVPYLREGAERDIDEKNEEIYQLILSELKK